MTTAVQSTPTLFALTFCLKTYKRLTRESQNIEFRAVIKFLTKKGANTKEIHQRMADVYGISQWQSGQQTPSGLQILVHMGKLFSLFLIQNTCLN